MIICTCPVYIKNVKIIIIAISAAEPIMHVYGMWCYTVVLVNTEYDRDGRETQVQCLLRSLGVIDSIRPNQFVHHASEVVSSQNFSSALEKVSVCTLAHPSP